MQYSVHLLRHFRLIIGRNIHNIRTERRLPLRRLARLSGVPERRIDHYELGKNAIRLDDILKLACALEIEAQALLAPDRPHRHDASGSTRIPCPPV